MWNSRSITQRHEYVQDRSWRFTNCSPGFCDVLIDGLGHFKKRTSASVITWALILAIVARHSQHKISNYQGCRANQRKEEPLLLHACCVDKSLEEG